MTNKNRLKLKFMMRIKNTVKRSVLSYHDDLNARVKEITQIRKDLND